MKDLIIVLTSGKELKFKNVRAATDKVTNSGRDFQRTGELYLERIVENQTHIIACFAEGKWDYWFESGERDTINGI